MLRLPKFEIATPTSVREAIDLLISVEGALVVAGGTDIVPNMKHELFTPPLVVSLARISSLRGITRARDGSLTIGAMTSLADVSASDVVNVRVPALAQACGLVAGPQLRSMGTLGGNVLLDTRCQWYNQTYFWREALGFCLKKDGSKCHVVEGGSKCVAAASNDSAPALMTLGARLVFEGPGGRRTTSIDDLWIADGIVNKRLERAEILVAIEIPPQRAGHRGAYGKLRERGSIDFPLFGVAVRIDVDARDTIESADVVVTALQARPVRIRHVQEPLLGVRLGTAELETAIGAVASQAHKQCHPQPNIPGDHAWRREMVPVYVMRTLRAACERTGPIHHV